MLKKKYKAILKREKKKFAEKKNVSKNQKTKAI